MRVSVATAGGTSSSLFTVVASGIQAGSGPSVVQTYQVAMSGLSDLYKRLSASGARIVSVSPASEESPAAPVSASSAPAPQAVTSAPAPKKKPHANVPVNTYKPKTPFSWHCHRELLVGGGRRHRSCSAHHLRSLRWRTPAASTSRARASASSPRVKTPTANHTSSACTPSPAPATATTIRTTPFPVCSSA